MSAADPRLRRYRGLFGILVACGLLALAAIETANALVQPALAPSDADWQAAARTVRAGFRTGDLIVASPSWADPVMRLHLGDLVPIDVAGRMDAARYGRVWAIGVRGARGGDSAGIIRSDVEHGGLTVRLVERKPAEVTYDFLARFSDARVVRREPGGDVACTPAVGRIQCPNMGWNFVQPSLLEIGGTLRRALYAQPVAGATMVIEYPQATLGRELAFAAGLHHVWLRKQGKGQVVLKIFIDGRQVAAQDNGNRSGFQTGRVDTSAFAGRSVPVRFEITAADAFSRHFGFVAEARNP